VSENVVVSVTDQENADESTERTFFGNNKELPKGFKKYVDVKLAHLYSAERKFIETVLIRFALFQATKRSFVFLKETLF
jgi:hypothetical protein